MINKERQNPSPPFLIGAKVCLRPLHESDLTAEYLRWLNDSEVTRYLEAGRFPIALDDLRVYLERFKHSKDDLIFAIVDKPTNLHIGNVTLNHIHWVHRTADTGLMIGRKEFWGKSCAYEAWYLIIDYAFLRLGLRKIIAGVVADHTASLRILQRLGFQIEGTLRKELLVEGEYRDTLRLGLFADEFNRAAQQRSASDS